MVDEYVDVADIVTTDTDNIVSATKNSRRFTKKSTKNILTNLTTVIRAFRLRRRALAA